LDQSKWIPTMFCFALPYLKLFCLLVGADAQSWSGGPATIAAPAPVHSEQAQLMARYADAWTQANENGFQATSKAMQAVNANDFEAAKWQAKVALAAFDAGLARCVEAQYMASRLPEPASSGAKQIIRGAQQRISENSKCAQLLSDSVQNLQKPVAACFKAWMTTTSPMPAAGLFDGVFYYDEHALEAAISAPNAVAVLPTPSSVTPNLKVFSVVKFPIVMVAGMVTMLALLVAGMRQWKKWNTSVDSVETDKMLVVDVVE